MEYNGNKLSARNTFLIDPNGKIAKVFPKVSPAKHSEEVLAALRHAGFGVLRVKGSHHFLQHPDGRRTVVPIHSGETIGPGLLNKILKDAEVGIEEFERWL